MGSRFKGGHNFSGLYCLGTTFFQVVKDFLWIPILILKRLKKVKSWKLTPQPRKGEHCFPWLVITNISPPKQWLQSICLCWPGQDSISWVTHYFLVWIIKPARSSSFWWIKKIPYQAPPSQHMCSSQCTASYHTKVQVILSTNQIGNGRSPKPLRFQQFRTNLWQKFSFHSLHMSDDFDFSMVLSFVNMNQGDLFEGSFLRVIFLVIFWVIFWG